MLLERHLTCDQLSIFHTPDQRNNNDIIISKKKKNSPNTESTYFYIVTWMKIDGHVLEISSSVSCQIKSIIKSMCGINESDDVFVSWFFHFCFYRV